MLGVMTPCEYVARGNIYVKGSNTLVFHALKVKDKEREDLVIRGFLQGILNITTT